MEQQELESFGRESTFLKKIKQHLQFTDLLKSCRPILFKVDQKEIRNLFLLSKIALKTLLKKIKFSMLLV